MGMKLDWGPWLYGLVAGFIGGGAASVGSALAAMHLAPGQFGVAGTQGWTSLKMVGITWLIGGGLVVVAFLMKSPLPTIETTVEVSKVEQPGVAPITTTKVSSTTQDDSKP